VPPFKRRWPFVLLAGLLMLLALAVITTLVSSRGVEGAVPGRAPILGLASIDGGFIAGTEAGVYVSPDGKVWSKPSQFAGAPALVTSVAANQAAILSAGNLFEVTGLSQFTKGPSAPKRAAAMASDPDGSIFISLDPGHLLVVRPGTPPASLVLRAGPREIVALDVAPPEGKTIFTGGLESGVWRMLAGGRWQRILKTPTRAVLIDALDPNRVFIGTAGGILLSTNQGFSWSFTAMRLPVEALTQQGHEYFAAGENRILYKSSDGKAWSTPRQSF